MKTLKALLERSKFQTVTNVKVSQQIVGKAKQEHWAEKMIEVVPELKGLVSEKDPRDVEEIVLAAIKELYRLNDRSF